MPGNAILMDGTRIWQPDEGLAYNFETTYSEDTQRLITGQLAETPLFTVEQLGYTASNIPISEASAILRKVATGRRFSLTYFSLYYGVWRTDTFYVGKGNASIGKLIPTDMVLDSLSFNMTGVNPIS